ncbi:MAG: hypothetical protein AAFQ17_00030 [Pseudomonadota bacterium]
MSGKDYLVYLSDDGTSTGNMTQIEDQGDLTVQPNKPNQRTTYKQGSKTAQGNDGWEATFTMGHREPLAQGQQLAWSQFEAGGDTYMEIKSAISGGVQWAGPVKIAISDFGFPVSGEPTVSVQLSENGTIVRGTTTYPCGKPSCTGWAERNTLSARPSGSSTSSRTASDRFSSTWICFSKAGRRWCRAPL